MKDASLTDEDRTFFAEAFRHLDRTNAYWEANVDRLQREYGGQWVAFKDDRILAHSADADELRQELDRMGAEAEHCVIRFIPTPETEFAFGPA